MPKSDQTRKSLRHNIAVEKELYGFLSKNPKASGEEAYDYLVKKGIKHDTAIEVITTYGTEQDEKENAKKLLEQEEQEEQEGADEELSVAGPPTSTIPPLKKEDEEALNQPEGKVVTSIRGTNENKTSSLNTNIASTSENNQRSIMSKTNTKNPKKATEQEAPINDEGAGKGTQAEGTFKDGGGPNCGENEYWDAEKETCKPMEGEGSTEKEAPPIVKAQTGVSDGGKSSESRRRQIGRERRVGSVNADIKTERRKTLEYLKKLDRIEAVRSLRIADARISAKEKYLKEKRLDALIRQAKEGSRRNQKFSIVPKRAQKAGEAITRDNKSAYATEVQGPYSWMQAVIARKNVPADYLWNVSKQDMFTNAQERFLKKFDSNDNTDFIPMTPEQRGVSQDAKATEALSVTGPPANDFMRIMSEQVLVLPSGKVVTPIRQFCETKILPPGTKEAFFYDFGAVTFSAITEDGTTSIGASTPLIRAAGGAVTPRGTLLTLGYTQLEEAPIDIVAAANRSYALESVNDESTEVLDVAYGDDTGSSGDATNRKAKGGGVKTIGNGHWVDNVGTQISADASGLGNLTFAGLVAAKGVIEDEGLDPSNIITYTTGKAIRDLIFDPDLDSFISFSRPAIITEATVERIAGTNVVRASQLKAGAQTGSSQSAMFIPNIAFGLVTGRDLTMEAQRRNELQVIFLTGTQRITGFVKNVEATCRISHL